MSSDETIVLAGSFNALGKVVAPGHGWTWIAAAWSIFRAQPGLWIGMMLALGVVCAVLFFVPFIGPLAFSAASCKPWIETIARTSGCEPEPTAAPPPIE